LAGDALGQHELWRPSEAEHNSTQLIPSSTRQDGGLGHGCPRRAKLAGVQRRGQGFDLLPGMLG